MKTENESGRTIFDTFSNRCYYLLKLGVDLITEQIFSGNSPMRIERDLQGSPWGSGLVKSMSLSVRLKV